jgi:hypothetical protein
MMGRRYEKDAAEIERRATVLREMLTDGKKLRQIERQAMGKASAADKIKRVRNQMVGGAGRKESARMSAGPNGRSGAPKPGKSGVAARTGRSRGGNNR